MAAAKQSARMLKAAKPGHFYLIHLLLPHHPYAYYDNCTVRHNGAAWLSYNMETKDGRANSPASRHERYQQYLEQMQCAHKTVAAILGELEHSMQQAQTHVVIHGDHGSRITQWIPSPQNSDHLLPTDYINAFSTFFVARTPTLRGGYDRHPYALEEIMAAVYFDESLPPTTSTAPPEVYLMSGEEVMKKTMPPFDNGEPAKSW